MVGYSEKKDKDVVETLIRIIDAALMQAVTLTDVIGSNNYDGIVARVNKLCKLETNTIRCIPHYQISLNLQYWITKWKQQSYNGSRQIAHGFFRN